MTLLTLRKLLIVQILKISNNEQKLFKNFYKILKYLNEENNFILYDKLIRILEVAAHL